MSKILSVIILIILIAGGVYFYKNNNKENIESGVPVANVITSSGDNTNAVVDFYPTHYGPTIVIPITYNVNFSKEDKKNIPKNAPKIMINCPAGVSAIIPNNRSTVQVDVCGKTTTMKKNNDIKSKISYELNLNFINSSNSDQQVNSEVILDSKIIKNKNPLIIPPAYTERSLGLSM